MDPSLYWGHACRRGPVTFLAWFSGPSSSDEGGAASRSRRTDAREQPRLVDPDDPDFPLLTRIRDGDEQAFATLFAQYAERVVTFAARYVDSVDTARDITQDVFIRVWERRASLPLSGIRLYLFRAARNRALDLLGHDAVAARWEAAVKRDDTQGARHVLNAGALRVEADEIATRVRAALATLTPRAREIVRLVREDGLKPGEVASLLGLTPATVYVHLSRALKQLAQALRD